MRTHTWGFEWRASEQFTRQIYSAARLISLAENSHALIEGLKPWQEEMRDAEAIFQSANPAVGDWCRWIHHEVEFERLSESWQNRFAYIASDKPEEERAWRFRMMRPAYCASGYASMDWKALLDMGAKQE